MTRAVMWALLAVVAAAAAVLSFSSLTDLAQLCGFPPRLAWLLPITIDAGAGAGCLVWLGAQPPERARRFARTLTWVLLGASVAGNAVVHGLTAYGLAAPWWLVVLVSGVAPAVLGAVVHLAVLVGRRQPEPAEVEEAEPAPAPVTAELVDEQPDRNDTQDTQDNALVARVAEHIEAALAAGEPVPGRRRLAAAIGAKEHEVRAVLPDALALTGAGR